MDPIKLRELAANELDEAREIQEKAQAEDRTMTQEEADSYNSHVTKSEKYLNEADRQERFNKIDDRIQKPQDKKSKPEITDGSSTRIEVIGSPKLYRYGKLQAFKGEDAQLNAYRSGRFLAAVLFNHAQSRQWCHEHGVEIRSDREFDKRAMSESINTAGGFLVPDEFEQAIIDLREEYGIARKELRIQPMASDHSNQPKKTGGLTAYPRGENQAATESHQQWGNVEMTARSWDVLTRISNELSEDAVINLADDIANDGARAFATAEDNACINGDGTSAYHGIIGIRTKMIDGSHAGSYYDVSTGCDEWADFTDAHLLKLVGLLPQYADANAKWHCSRVAKLSVFDRLSRAAGGNTVINMATGIVKSYADYPIVVWPSMPSDDSGAALNNKIMLMFGDLRLSSKIGARRGITIAKLTELYATSGQIGIMMTERFDINHHSITGNTPATDRGPIIGFYGGT
jgi:HK97 family phage major capsid protein